MASPVASSMERVVNTIDTTLSRSGSNTAFSEMFKFIVGALKLGNSGSPHLESCSVAELTDDVNIIRGKLRTAENEITQLMQEGYQEVELKAHVEKLHQYNQLKDTGQMLLGRIATIDGVRTKDMYENYGLELDD